MTKKLNRNGLPKKIVEEIEKGRRLTTSEWAQALGVSPSRVGFLLNYLRKKGYHFHPIGGQRGFCHHPKEGKIMDVMTDESLFAETNITNMKDNKARLSSMFRLLEDAWTVFPQQRIAVEEGILEFQTKILEARKTLLALNEPKINADMFNITEQIKTRPKSAKKEL